MKTLIAEDDFTSRLLLQELLKDYGPCHIAANGAEAVVAAETARAAGAPYDLVCLDIMMPEMDGATALTMMREQEKSRGILSSNGSKILMTTAVDDVKTIVKTFYELADGYLFKPIGKAKLRDELRSLGLIQ
jgi:two-component system chemotaxis response regulator CheY